MDVRYYIDPGRLDAQTPRFTGPRLALSADVATSESKYFLCLYQR